MKKILLYTLGGIILFTVISAVTQLWYTRGLLPELLGHTEITDQVYASKNLPVDSLDRIISVIDSALIRNKDFWGNSIDLPRIIYCHNRAEIEKYNPAGATYHAAAYISIVGEHIVANNIQLNTHIMSHELSHLFFYDRLGSFKYAKLYWKTPIWFDEGLAMQVDHRKEFSEEKYLKFTQNGKITPNLACMETNSQFFRQDSLWWRYAASKFEVKRWLDIVGKQGLNELISSITLTSDFTEEYYRIEQKYRQP